MEEISLSINDYASRESMHKYIEKQISDLRDSLESPFIEQRLADYYRGQIAALKQINSSITE